MTTTSDVKDELASGRVVQVRGLRWVISDVVPFSAAGSGGRPSSTLVELQSVEDDRFNEALSVIWEVEPDARVLPTSSLPDPSEGFDEPQRLAAFLDAVRWGAVASADVNALQAPFRSGVRVEDYQLEPVARALTAPRVNLLLADDVGLGKTIEAGLVAVELLLRQRARRIMVICPAGLTVKWRQEMAEKFGREFTVVNSEQCAVLRRTHGSAANPFRVYPLTIVSLPWLRSPRAQRLLDEVLPVEGPADTREFDLLILDEAHHVAPAAPKQRYAVDSQQTKLIRRLAPHFEHRLFLTATPHNGYPESFEALLELVDNQRFARGVPPDRQAQREVVIRRLKAEILEPDGSKRFRQRRTEPLPVQYPEDERHGHALLTEFAAARGNRLKTNRRGRRAADLVTLLFKKRLFSSPVAFGRTVAVYRENQVAGSAPPASGGTEPAWMDDFLGDIADLDDEEMADEEDDAVRRATILQGGPSDTELELLERMRLWAEAHTPNPDAKASELLKYLRAVCHPDRDWTNERVVVFTEYRDTQDWLVRLLQQDGLGAGVRVLHGGMNAVERENLRQAFQADPTEDPVRILIATDAASEGIDLHWQCHRLINYDIPFNPNKLEQRIGRIDRYGQRFDPEVFHFVGTGFGRAVDTYEADLEFLARVAEKVARMEEDLGAVNAVLADAVQRRMLGQHVDLDHAVEEPRRTRKGRVASDADIAGQVQRLHAQLTDSVAALNLNPQSLKRVVDTALALSHQQPLTRVNDPDPVWDVPALTGTWEITTRDLPHPLRPDQRRPVTFDAEIAARRREDVVFVHLGHPLVTRATRLLRAAVTSTDIDLHRVAAVLSDDAGLEDTLAVSYARFLVVGGDGARLHEEVLHAGGWVRPDGRFARVESFARLDAQLTAALAQGRSAPRQWTNRLAAGWSATQRGLFLALERRADNRRTTVGNLLDRRRQAEEDRITTNLDSFAKSLRQRLSEADDEGTEVGLFARHLADPNEAAQFRRDRQSWEERLDRLPAERDAEVGRIAARYAQPADHLFPVAVIFVVPTRLVTR